MKSYILFFFVLMTIGVSGQVRLMVANKAYETGDYYYAIENYKKVLENYDDTHDSIKCRLGECYYHVSDFENAEKFYQSIVDKKNIAAKHYLYYAKVLTFLDRCEEAIPYFIEYEQSNKQWFKPLNLENYCESLVDLELHPSAFVKNVDSINNLYLGGFCPFIYDDHLGYIGLFNDGKLEAGIPNSVRIAPNHPTLPSLKYFRNTYYKNGDPINSLSIHCTPSNEVYFSKVKYFKKKIGDDIIKTHTTHLYHINLKEGNAKPEPIPFNSSDYNCKNAILNTTETIMVFTSNVKGGYGGNDLYYSMKNELGVWTRLKNLGPFINTTENENFPYFENDSTLYFSSNGHIGFGGMDIYKCKIKVTKDSVQVIDGIEILGFPFNSFSNDGSIVFDTTKQHGYLTSDRSYDRDKGACTISDIWEFWLK